MRWDSFRATWPLLALAFAGLVASGAGGAASSSRDLSRSLSELEARIALSKPGVQVCREMTVGIGVSEWIRGEVQNVEGNQVVVRITDPGKLGHTVQGVVLVAGTPMGGSVLDWVPCW